MTAKPQCIWLTSFAFKQQIRFHGDIPWDKLHQNMHAYKMQPSSRLTHNFQIAMQLKLKCSPNDDSPANVEATVSLIIFYLVDLFYCNLLVFPTYFYPT